MVRKRDFQPIMVDEADEFRELREFWLRSRWGYGDWQREARRREAAGFSRGVVLRCRAYSYVPRKDEWYGFYRYCKEVLGYQDLYDRFHVPIAKLVTSKKKYKMLQACRGSFKSSIATVGKITWRIGKEYLESGESSLRILVASEVLAVANKFVKQAKQVMSWNVGYKELFGDHSGEVGWTDKSITSRYRMNPNLAEPTLSAIALGVDRSGFHWDLIVCDDLEAERSSASRDQIENVWDFYRLLHSLLEPKGELDIVSTRWHYDDIYSRILKANDKENKTRRYETLIVPAVTGKGRLTFPTRFDRETLAHLRETQGSYIYSCTPGETKILMADWSLKPIRDVKVGDEILGFQRYDSVKGRGKGRRHSLKKTKVLNKNSRMAHVVKITMDSGRWVRCTPEHAWYTGRSDENHRTYKPATIGGRLLYVTNTNEYITQSELGDYRYLAGMIDGEGSCKSGNGIYIHQCPVHNPEVHREIRATITRLGIPYTDRGNVLWLTGGIETKEKVLRFGKPAKANQIIDNILMKRFVRRHDKVIDIKYDGYERVYSLETETGNYVAGGYASKNCQMLLNPVPDEDRTFKEDWIQYVTPELLRRTEKLRVFVGVDMAYTPQEFVSRGEVRKADFTVVLTVGIDSDWNYIILDYSRERCTKRRAVETFFDHYFKHNAALVIQQKFDRMLIQDVVRQYAAEVGKMPYVEYISYPSRQTNQERIRTALQPLFEARKVYILPGMEWFIHELLDFPRGAFDDGCNALCNVVHYSHPPSARMNKEKESYWAKRIKRLKAGKDPSGEDVTWDNV